MDSETWSVAKAHICSTIAAVGVNQRIHAHLYISMSALTADKLLIFGGYDG